MQTHGAPGKPGARSTAFTERMAAQKGQDLHPLESRTNVPVSTAGTLGLGEEGDGICHVGILSPVPV